MFKTNRSTLHMIYNIQQSATRHTDYYAEQQQQPDLVQRVGL